MKIFYLLLMITMPVIICAQVIPPMNSKYLNDIEDVFEAREEKILKQLLKKTSKIKNDQICLLTVSDFGSYENLDKFAYTVSNHWKLGPKGILIVMSKNKRRIRIETGAEIWSRLTNEECQSIIEHQIVPSFKESKYFEGISNCLGKIAEELK